MRRLVLFQALVVFGRFVTFRFRCGVGVGAGGCGSLNPTLMRLFVRH